MPISWIGSALFEDAVTLTEESGKVLGEYIPISPLVELMQLPHPANVDHDELEKKYGPGKTLDEWKRELGWD